MVHVPLSLVYIAEDKGELIPQWRKESAFNLTSKLLKIGMDLVVSRYSTFSRHML